ncbi:phage tail family protein [Sediminibacillus terrae]|uniref:phage tail family protein n=1 Tax=Sediminibacillus terrae TaxID=1562106 RepID=UPI001295465E|nr:phage tail family protein [Sediminibacillus terrae]
MKKITFTNTRGESIVIGSQAPFFLTSIDGLGDVEADNQSQKAPYQDGSIPFDSRLEERVIPFTVSIKANTPGDLPGLRQTLARVFNPKLGEGTLTYEDGYQTKVIKGKADSIPTFPSGKGNRTPLKQTSSVSLTCYDPYWKDPQEVSRALKAYEGRFTFPFNFPVEFGVEGDSTSIYNEGDVETPVQINIQGPVSNPMVKNRTTGDYIRIWRTLSADEVLHIDTNQQNKRVEIYLNGSVIQKAWGYLDDYSELFKLIPGQNEISYVADSSTDNAIASIAWKNRYVGI